MYSHISAVGFLYLLFYSVKQKTGARWGEWNECDTVLWVSDAEMEVIGEGSERCTILFGVPCHL